MEIRQTVLSILEHASSQDPRQVALAEELLKDWEIKPMFHATAFDIFADRSLPMGVRWLAIISFKNNIDKYWKKTAQHAIRLEEKALVRPRLLDYFDEENPQIAIQYCVAVSRIARWEFPRVWPEFINVLTARIQEIVGKNNAANPDRRQIMEHNILYTLHLFVKVMCQRTLEIERQALKRLTPVVFKIIAPVYAERISQFNDALQSGSAAQFYGILKSIRLCVKTMRRLFAHGYRKSEPIGNIAIEFYKASINHQSAFYSLFASLPPDGRESADGLQLRKIILLYGKIYLEFQKSDAIRFITMDCVKIMLQWYWVQIETEAPKLVSLATSTDSHSEAILEPLLIQGIELYRNVVKNFYYMVDEGVEMDSSVKRCRQIIDNEIIVPEFVAQMAQMLINYYIPLKPKDIEMWQNDPETWVVEEESDYWEFDIRRSAERLFVDVIDQHRVQMVPQLNSMVWNIQLSSDATVAFFQREGLYAALGLCVNQLYDDMDFCKWLKEHPIVDSPLGVVKWRIAWLIGRWVPVKFPASERGNAYSLLLQLARTEEPLIVRMEALASLLRCIDNDWDFDTEQFKPYLQQSIELITGVLGDANKAESQMRIVGFLSTLICRMQRDIVPYADSIVSLIPPLWQSAAEENLYQTTILALVVKLAEALGTQSVVLQPFVVPLIQHSVDLDNPAHVYLLEDGLDLWLALVRNGLTIDPAVRALLKNIPKLLQYSTETLKKVLKIIEGNLLIDGASIFTEYGHVFLHGLCDLVADKNLTARAIAAGYATLNILVQCVPLEICIKPLTETNGLWLAFTHIVDKKEEPMILVHHAAFMSRVAVSYPSLFSEFLASQDIAITKAFVESWIDLYDDVGQVTQQRLFAIGLAVAIATTNSGVLQSLDSMVPIWNDIMSNTGSSLVYFSDVDDDLPDDSDEMIAENQRRKNMLANDPVHKFDIRQILTQSMSECERLNGPERFREIVAQVAPADFEDFKNQISQ
ncbi:hypothetical protein LPJ73_000053 [Coemansia sp. RSA 2703]|nr:hypothetical protein LPJ73_000053 [Coemansia sp. RSA 2703]KAJ2376226.1 hypothetical protein IW150_002108 [Coemansia sp. RSA 2607]KAJ2398433.1 hypothetical protein GGI05_000094 [Coemansia sp. RSA 2603]